MDLYKMYQKNIIYKRNISEAEKARKIGDTTGLQVILGIVWFVFLFYLIVT
jgi:hypothetical protein|tara:strand:+ start:385 stop:537 length:153 start_codon:yes stop_codon:yes gene_type:complete